MNTVIAVDKELYEAVLRNSARVNDLEAENYKLKEINLWHSEKSWNCEKEKQQLRELLKECKEVIYDLVDDEPCQEDHHGYCQAHRWMSTELCPNERGKRLLTKIDEVLK